MNKYQNGKIYKIVNDVNDECYVGSTTRLLCQRMTNHISDMKKENKKNSKLYKCMTCIGIDHFSIILLEHFSCESSLELRKRENQYITALKPTLNNNKAYATKEERKQMVRDLSSRYYKEHKEECQTKYKKYYDTKAKFEKAKPTVCECGKTVRKSNISFHLKSKYHRNFVNSI